MTSVRATPSPTHASLSLLRPLWIPSWLGTPSFPPIHPPTRSDPFVQSFTKTVLNEKTQRGLIRVTAALFLIVGLVGASILAYAAFYHAYVPSLSYSTPIYLHYANPLHPTARLEFTPEQGVLAQDQPYDVTIELDVPMSDRNVDMGNFMLSLELFNVEGSIVYAAHRPAIVPYQSTIHRLARTLFYLPLLIFSFAQEAQHLSVPMLESITVPSRVGGIQYAQLNVTSTQPLDVYRMSLQFKAHLSGLRYLMYYWRLPTATFFITSFMVWSLVFAVVSWRVLTTWWNERLMRESEQAMEEFEEEEVPVTSHVDKLRQELSQVENASVTESSYEHVEGEEGEEGEEDASA